MSVVGRTVPISDGQRAQSPKLLTPVTEPIPLLSIPIVRPYSSAHTIGVLLYYYLRAGRLVADPLATLVQDVIAIAALQAAFCAVCLPVAGHWNCGATNDGASGSNKTPSKRKGAPFATGAKTTSVGATLQQRVMVVVFSLILTLSVPPVPLTLLALVLGAPLYPTSQLPHTGALSLHVALLAFLPIFYTHGVSARAWRDVAAAWLPFDEAGVWGGAVGCMLGGWVGAIPIALDWDRDWQKWPCTVVWGAVVGWAIGRTFTGTLRLGIGKRIDLSEGKRFTTAATTQIAGDIAERKSK